jgi:hypothetical protein
MTDQVAAAARQYESKFADGVDEESVKSVLAAEAWLRKQGKDPATCTAAEYLEAAGAVGADLGSQDAAALSDDELVAGRVATVLAGRCQTVDDVSAAEYVRLAEESARALGVAV